MLRIAPILCAVLVLLVVPAGSTAASFRIAPGGSAPSGPGSVVRFTVEVERGLDESPAQVVRELEWRVFDHRGWGAHRRESFQRVSRGRVDLRIVLASPATTDRMCAPTKTHAYWNCYARGVVVLNHDRWHVPAPTYRKRGPGPYRTLMVMHELGHALGHDHAPCPRAGALAPPMLQQGKGLHGCRANPWAEPNAPLLASACSLTASRTRAEGFIRLRGRLQWVGLRGQLRFEERVGTHWRTLARRSTDGSGHTALVARSDSSYVRIRFTGNASRGACSDVAAVR